MMPTWSDTVNECEAESGHHVRGLENKYCDTGMNGIIMKMTPRDLQVGRIDEVEMLDKKICILEETGLYTIRFHYMTQSDT